MSKRRHRRKLRRSARSTRRRQRRHPRRNKRVCKGGDLDGIDTLTIATFNMENGVGMTNPPIYDTTNPPIYDTTNTQSPDIICLQEVYDSRLSSNRSIESKPDKKDSIKRFFKLPDHYEYVSEDTNAIMYDSNRFSVIGKANKIVREYNCAQKIKEDDTSSTQQVKSTMWIKFKCDTSGQEFIVVCAHLKAGCELRGSNNDLEWSNIINKLLVYSFDTPVFICGDFNRDPTTLNKFIRQDKNAQKHLFTLVSNNKPTQFPARMRSAKKGFNLDYGGKQILGSLPNNIWKRTIDGIFYDATKCSPKEDTTQTISMDGISDHDLLQCTFQFKNANDSLMGVASAASSLGAPLLAQP